MQLLERVPRDRYSTCTQCPGNTPSCAKIAASAKMFGLLTELAAQVPAHTGTRVDTHAHAHGTRSRAAQLTARVRTRVRTVWRASPCSGRVRATAHVRPAARGGTSAVRGQRRGRQGVVRARAHDQQDGARTWPCARAAGPA